MTEIKMKDTVPNTASKERAGKLTQSSALVIPTPSQPRIHTTPLLLSRQRDGEPDDRSEARRNFAEAKLSTFPGACSCITQLLSTGKRTETSGQIIANVFQGKINTSLLQDSGARDSLIC